MIHQSQWLSFEVQTPRRQEVRIVHRSPFVRYLFAIFPLCDALVGIKNEVLIQGQIMSAACLRATEQRRRFEA